jgi:hypothetical protein
MQMQQLHQLQMQKLQQMPLQSELRQIKLRQIPLKLPLMHKRPQQMLRLPLHLKLLKMLQMLHRVLLQRRDVLMLYLCKQHKQN